MGPNSASEPWCVQLDSVRQQLVPCCPRLSSRRAQDGIEQHWTSFNGGFSRYLASFVDILLDQISAFREYLHLNRSNMTASHENTERKGPYRLVTVNKAPERAKLLIGRLIEALAADYDITHVGNCSSALRSALHHSKPCVECVLTDISLQPSRKSSPVLKCTDQMYW